jgi:hypothetical protein
LTLHWDTEFCIKGITDLIVDTRVAGGNGEIIHLTKEEDVLALDKCTIEAGSMYCRGEAKVLENGVDVF